MSDTTVAKSLYKSIVLQEDSDIFYLVTEHPQNHKSYRVLPDFKVRIDAGKYHFFTHNDEIFL